MRRYLLFGLFFFPSASPLSDTMMGILSGAGSMAAVFGTAQLCSLATQKSDRTLRKKVRTMLQACAQQQTELTIEQVAQLCNVIHRDESYDSQMNQKLQVLIGLACTMFAVPVAFFIWSRIGRKRKKVRPFGHESILISVKSPNTKARKKPPKQNTGTTPRSVESTPRSSPSSARSSLRSPSKAQPRQLPPLPGACNSCVAHNEKFSAGSGSSHRRLRPIKSGRWSSGARRSRGE